jgi:cytoskeletal protein CcmA (bactofilin family)
MGIFGKPGDPKPPTAPVDHPARPAPPAPAPTPLTAAQRAAGTCVIGPKITLKGELLGDEDVVIEGTVEGQVRISRDLRVGQGGTVRAKIDAHSIVVSGEVVGDCVAATRVELHPTGRLTGNIRAPKIVIAEGAMFKGNSDMSGRKDERKDDRKDKLAAY